MLSSIYREKFKKEIKILKNKNDITKDKNIDKKTLFEIYEQDKIIGYFILDTNVYQQWIKDYKMKGIEI